MKNKTTISLLAVGAAAGLSSSALAVGNGDIIFTDAMSDTVNLISGGPGFSQLYQFADPGDEIRLADITRANGRYYVGSGFGIISDPAVGFVFELDNLFGATSQSTVVSSDPAQNPLGLEFHSKSNKLVMVNNPAQSAMAPNEQDGIYGISLDGGSFGTTNQIFDEDVGSTTFPRYQAGAGTTRDRNNPNTFYVATVNGGATGGTAGGDEVKGSAIYSVTLDASGGPANPSLLFDFSNTSFGEITFVRDVTTDGSNLYIGDGFSGAIYSISLADPGDLSTLSLVKDGLTRPQNLIYNQFTDKLVWSDNFDEAIYQMDLDGSNMETLATGINARGFYIVPTPGAVALFGLAGIAGVRRRR